MTIWAVTSLICRWPESIQHALLKDIERGGALDGIGKPEPLKGELEGFYSRHIDEMNRLVYRIVEGALEILSCKGHYDL